MISDEILFEEPKVKLIAYTRGSDKYHGLGPDELSAFGALGCFEEKISIDLYKGISKEKIEKKKEAILRESAGRGHGSVLDQNYFIYSIENLTRATTLQLCLPEYLAHLQQSLRRAKADRGFYIPEEIRNSNLFSDTKEILYDSFKLYEEMLANEIPGEDARFILPLYTKTNIQTGGDARELMHLQSMNSQDEVPSAVRKVVNEMTNEARKVAPKLFKYREKSYETLAWYPSAQLYSTRNETINNLIEECDYPNKTTLISYDGIDINEKSIEKAIKERNEAELANLKHIHFTFLAPMSLACYHQATRQRTWNHSLESIYDAAKRKKTKIPPSFLKITSIKIPPPISKYKEQESRMFDLYEDLIRDGIPRSEAIGIIPHSLEIYDLIHVNGWNAIHSIGKRTCVKAQWEIRSIAKEMANYIKEKNPVLGK